MNRQPKDVKSLGKYRIWVSFQDGTEGVVDLSHLAGKGVFKAWEEPGFFEKVHVSSEAQTVTWPGEIDLDPHVLYCEATGKNKPRSGDQADQAA